jgi:uncharacterized membrane protein
MASISFPEKKSYFAKNWFALMLGLLLLFVVPPFLAPVFMSSGWHNLGRGIYLIYSILCHQLPERSYFLFGPQLTYPLAQILQVTGVNNPNNFIALRQFIGNAQMGWKIAWSDRMVWMFTVIPLFALIWYPLRRHLPRLPLWGFILLLLPMALDGGTHFVSDLQGFGIGFRDTNPWLGVLTNHLLPSSFYAGDAWGSFNSIMRMGTGILFGQGIVWFVFPYLEDAVSSGVQG